MVILFDIYVVYRFGCDDALMSNQFRKFRQHRGKNSNVTFSLSEDLHQPDYPLKLTIRVFAVCMKEALVRMYPWSVCIHGPYVSMVRMYPWSECIHGPYVSMVRMYPWSVCIHGPYVSFGPYVSMVRMYPCSVCIHGQYVSMVRMYPLVRMYPW